MYTSSENGEEILTKIVENAEIFHGLNDVWQERERVENAL
jgi:hypothetical protein